MNEYSIVKISIVFLRCSDSLLNIYMICKIKRYCEKIWHTILNVGQTVEYSELKIYSVSEYAKCSRAHLIRYETPIIQKQPFNNNITLYLVLRR